MKLYAIAQTVNISFKKIFVFKLFCVCHLLLFCQIISMYKSNFLRLSDFLDVTLVFVQN